MGENITLQDISEATGFSIVTVSRALSGQKGVSARTRAYIGETAEKLGYRGQEEKTARKTGSIGVIAPERTLTVHESMYWSLYQELTRRLSEKKLFGILEIVAEENERNVVRPSVLDNPDVGGVIVLGFFDRPYREMLEKEAGVPLAFLDGGSISGDYDSVISNSYLGGYEVTSHLLDLGHRDIGYVGTLLVTDSIDDRFLGAQKAMMKRGLQITKDRIYEDRDRTTRKVSADLIRLDRDSLPTAFFCNCDLTAGILIGKLRGMGLRVPEDISVAGFDNFLADPMMQDFITTYDIDMAQMAKKAVHVITHRIANSSYRNGLSIIQGHFLARQSTQRIGPAVPAAESFGE